MDIAEDFSGSMGSNRIGTKAADLFHRKQSAHHDEKLIHRLALTHQNFSRRNVLRCPDSLRPFQAGKRQNRV